MSQLLNVGSVPNDGTGDNLRLAGQKINRLPNPSHMVNADSGDYTGTTPQKLTAATADALVQGKTIVWVPRSMWTGGYDITQVTLNAAVRFVGEGRDQEAYDLAVYGLIGDGGTNEAVKLQTVLNIVPAYGRLRAQEGKTYIVSRTNLPGADPTKFITPFVPTAGIGMTLDLRGATVKVQGSAFDVGGGGGGLGVLNVVADDVSIIGGTIDCANIAAFAIAAKMWDGTNGRGLYLSNVAIANTNESFAHAWTGIILSLGTDVPGTSITATYHKELSGSFKRPNCPILDPLSDTITAHGDTTGTIIGGPTTDTGSSYGVLTRSTAMWNMNWQKPDPKGIWLFPKENDRNGHLLDLIVNDLGTNNIELYGAMGAQTQRPNWGSSIIIDVNKGQDMVIAATSNIAATCAAPTNLPNSSDRTWRIRLIFFNNAGADLTTPIAFTTGAGAYKANGGVPLKNGQRVTVEFTYDMVNNLWVEQSRAWTLALPTLFQATNLTTTATSETSIVSYTVPTGLLTTDGQILRVTYCGRATTQNVTPKLNINATNAGTQVVTAGNVFKIVVECVRFDANNGRFTITFFNGTTIATTSNTSGITWASAAVPIDFRGSVVSGGTLNLDVAEVEFLGVPGL